MFSRLMSLLITFSVAGAASAQEANPCGPLQGIHYGPFDYRTQRARLQIVEVAHFTPGVESLIRGATGDLGKDIAYTLRASPNHHRALAAIIRWSQRAKSNQLPGMEYSVDCWFDRAIRFAPDDTVARSLFAQYAGLRGDLSTLGRQLEYVLANAGENALTVHNAGLVYFEAKLYDQALVAAHRAMELGMVNSRLEAALKQANRWQDPKP